MNHSRIRAIATLGLLGAFSLPLGTFAQTENPAAEAPLVLSPFSVTSESDRGFGNSTATTGTRMNVKLIDIPQSVSIVSEKLIKDLAADSLLEALIYTPGVVSGNIGQLPQTVVIRGFGTSRNFRNGVRLSRAYYADFGPVQRIEIIKGPASAVSGRGEVGGVINYITKKPLKDRDQAVVGLTFGTDNFRRAEIDLNKTVEVAGGLDMRLIASSTESDGWRANEPMNRTAFLPSVHWRVSEKTNVYAELEYHTGLIPSNFGHHYNSIDNVWAPFEFSVSEAGTGKKTDALVTFLTADHKFADWVTVRQTIHTLDVKDHDKFVFSDYIRKAVAGNPTFAVGEVYFGRTLNDEISRAKAFIAQTDVLFEYQLGPVKNTTLASYEYSFEEQFRNRSDASLTELSMTRPVYGATPTNYRAVLNQKESVAAEGILVSHQSNLFNDRLILTAGWRKDRNAGRKLSDYFASRSTNDAATSVNHPRYGATVKVLPNVAVYGIYSKNGDPTTTVKRFVDLPLSDPRQSTVVVAANSDIREAGIKSELFQGRLTATFAVFKMQRRGGVTPTSFGPGQNDPTTAGLVENIILPADTSKGFELEFVGSVLSPRLNIVGGYSRTNTTRYFGGQLLEFRGIPNDRYSLLANYDFSNNGKGFAVFAGYSRQGSLWLDNANTFRIPGAYRADMGGSYKSGDWRLGLSVTNLTNQIVPVQVNAFRANAVLPPREVRLSVTKKW